MVRVVGVRFKKAGKIYYFDPEDQDIETEDNVIVETARGLEFGQIVIGPRTVDEEEIIQPLKRVIRKATEEDVEKDKENKAMAKEALNICTSKILDHELDMRLIDVEYTFDNNKVIFYFTSDGRVDFRDLVKDLATIFKTRIELRQIGVRDESKMVGGIGPCGREICCAKFLGDFEAVSIKMAKDQGLSLNPTKISGLCGRLMCCLNYEQETYKHLKKDMPEVGVKVLTPMGKGIIIDTYILLQMLKVKVHLEDDTEEIFNYRIDEVILEGEPKKQKEEKIEKELIEEFNEE